MAPTANMNLVLPVDHGSADTWDVLLDACFGLIDAHDHSNGKGVRVPVAGLDINDDLSFASGGLYAAAVDVLAVDFEPTLPANVAGYAAALFVSSVDNNLYFRTTSGTNVKMIDGVTLNVAGFAGGIGGDYTAVGALFSYDDATKSYWAQTQAVAGNRSWARLRAADIDIYEQAALIANRVRLQSPGALAASYAVTLFAALPASTLAVQLSAAGLLSASNTFASALTAPDYRFSTAQAFTRAGASWADVNATHLKSASPAGAQVGVQLAASANKLTMPLDVREGDVINSYTLWMHKDTNAAATVSSRLYRRRDSVLGTETALTAGTGTETSSLNAPGEISLVGSAIAHTVAAGFQYYIVFTPSASVAPAPDLVYGVTYTVTRP